MHRPSKVKEVAVVLFALAVVFAGVALWAFYVVDSLSDCTNRGHSVSWCILDMEN
jgi:hypothetical protein